MSALIGSSGQMASCFYDRFPGGQGAVYLLLGNVAPTMEVNKYDTENEASRSRNCLLLKPLITNVLAATSPGNSIGPYIEHLPIA